MIRPALLYGSETWSIKKAEERKMQTTKKRILRWMIGKTRKIGSGMKKCFKIPKWLIWQKK